jgi:hypothetical protein
MANIPEAPILTLSQFLAALGALAGTILSLVGLLYHQLISADKDQQEQLDAGADQFTLNKLEIAKIQKDLESIREWVVEIETDLDTFQIKALHDHEAVLLIKDHHRRNHGEEIK